MAENKNPAEMYQHLREMAFGVTAPQLGVPLPTDRVAAYGTIMEMSLPRGTVTLVSYETGDASIYLSTGGGIIGGGGHEAVRSAAKKLVSSGGALIAKLKAAIDHPEPTKGKVIFYVLTNNGVFRSDEMLEDDLGRNRSELSSLFYAGQDVITQLRLISPP